MVINIFSASAITSAKLDTFCNMEIRILGFTYKGLPSQLTYFFTWGNANTFFFLKSYFFYCGYRSCVCVYLHIHIYLYVCIIIYNNIVFQVLIGGRTLSYKVALFSNGVSLIMFGNIS